MSESQVGKQINYFRILTWISFAFSSLLNRPRVPLGWWKTFIPNIHRKHLFSLFFFSLTSCHFGRSLVHISATHSAPNLYAAAFCFILEFACNLLVCLGWHLNCSECVHKWKATYVELVLVLSTTYLQLSCPNHQYIFVSWVQHNFKEDRRIACTNTRILTQSIRIVWPISHADCLHFRN